MIPASVHELTSYHQTYMHHRARYFLKISLPAQLYWKANESAGETSLQCSLTDQHTFATSPKRYRANQPTGSSNHSCQKKKRAQLQPPATRACEHPHLILFLAPPPHTVEPESWKLASLSPPYALLEAGSSIAPESPRLCRSPAAESDKLDD